MEFSFRERSQHVQLSKPNGALTKFQPSGLIQQAATVAAPTVVAISFAATTSSHDPYLSTKMMRLAEDGAMFTIARFEKQFSYLQGHGEILRIACKGAGISSRCVH
jgi:hypothetical protein